MDNTEYIGFIPFTDDQPCEIAVGILCLKDCKTLDTESIFTQLMTKETWLQIHAMKAYAEVEKLQLYELLITAQSASCPGLFNSRESMWSAIGSWMDPRSSQNIWKKNLLVSSRN